MPGLAWLFRVSFNPSRSKRTNKLPPVFRADSSFDCHAPIGEPALAELTARALLASRSAHIARVAEWSSVGDGAAKTREDAVTVGLHDVPVRSGGRPSNHQLQRGIDNRARAPLGNEILLQLGPEAL